ncbi:hypothetical protein ACWEQL_19445 [Kitasatospora sp. NPDC004240]
MKRSDVVLVLVARVRLALAAAGLGWLLGWQPGAAVRVALGVLVVAVLVVDTAGNESERRTAGGMRRRTAGAG